MIKVVIAIVLFTAPLWVPVVFGYLERKAVATRGKDANPRYQL